MAVETLPPAQTVPEYTPHPAEVYGHAHHAGSLVLGELAPEISDHDINEGISQIQGYANTTRVTDINEAYSAAMAEEIARSHEAALKEEVERSHEAALREEVERSHDAAIAEEAAREAKQEAEKAQATDATQPAAKEGKEQAVVSNDAIIEAKIKEAQLKNDTRAEASAILEQVADRIQIPLDSRVVKDRLTVT